MKLRMLFTICSVLAVGRWMSAKERWEVSPRAVEHIQKEVRHELIMLPYLGVFDNLAYRVKGSDVTLVGKVTRPTLKSEAENVVKKIEGVERVNNEIEVLPLSAFDNTLRLRLFHAIYGYDPLQKYALGVDKPIRIIVKNGHVTLEGVVDNEADKNIAGIRANGVADVFSVTNNLQIAK
jgi:hyperosmotically inducible periplasmic protein